MSGDGESIDMPNIAEAIPTMLSYACSMSANAADVLSATALIPSF